MLNDETMIIRTKADDAKLTKRRRRILGVPMVVAAPLAVALTFGGAALAALALQSDEATASVAAGSAQDLKITQPQFTRDLLPGLGSDLKFVVSNPNSFTAKVTNISMAGNPTVNCVNPADLAHLSGPSGALSTLALAAPVTLSPGEAQWVTIHNAVKLDNSATKGCALTITFKLSGEGSPTAGE